MEKNFEAMACIDEQNGQRGRILVEGHRGLIRGTRNSIHLGTLQDYFSGKVFPSDC